MKNLFSACGDVVFRRRERSLYPQGMIAFESELLAKVFYCLQTCAFANGCLFLMTRGCFSTDGELEYAV